MQPVGRPGDSGVRPGILLVDDYVLVLEAMTAYLEASGFLVLGSAPNGDEAIRKAEELRPAVAVFDVSNPLVRGVQTALATHRCSPLTKRVLLVDEETIRVSPPGMSAYINKSAGADLVDALRHIHRGNPYFSEGLSAASLRPMEVSGDPRRGLTAREWQILQLIAAGGSNKEISAELRMAPNTVRSHRANLMSKLAVHDVASLVRLAILWEYRE